MDSRARYIMIGGFLGAGKTTAIQAFAKHLDAERLKVGLITNDQGMGLADTALGKSNRFPVEEISGGCFCCRFNSLMDAAHSLSALTRPDVFLAEPVGSCTDLVATVSLPLQQIYGEDYVVAPLSVLVDPVRALRVLGLEEGKRLSENVRYIYQKQLEEAELIIINKIDAISEAQREQLRSTLAEQYPRAEIHEISAKEGLQLGDWFERTMSAEMNPARLLQIDYQRYGEGEALLGWLNATLRLESPDGEEWDGNALLEKLAARLREQLDGQGIEVAHLKMTLTLEGDPYEIAAINVVRSDAEPYMSHRLTEPVDVGLLSLNLRAEGGPDTLKSVTEEALAEIIPGQLGLSYDIAHMEAFRPGQPNPTHRVSAL